MTDCCCARRRWIQPPRRSCRSPSASMKVLWWRHRRLLHWLQGAARVQKQLNVITQLTRHCTNTTGIKKDGTILSEQRSTDCMPLLTATTSSGLERWCLNGATYTASVPLLKELKGPKVISILLRKSVQQLLPKLSLSHVLVATRKGIRVKHFFNQMLWFFNQVIWFLMMVQLKWV